MKYLEKIKNYYDSSQWLYKLFVYDETSLGMHFGFWEKSTKNRHEAIINENQAIIDIGKIKKGMKVLDAGCGVGGTAIYIAKKTGAKVWGITLSQNQVKLAQKYANKNKVSDLTRFEVQDFHKTKFPDNFFDIVYGIESICHAYPKSKFLKEAYRLLKPGGQLIIADGYSSRVPKNPRERKIVKDFNDSFVLKELVMAKKMEREINKAGFTKIQTVNKRDKVLPGARYYYYTVIRKFSFIIKIISKLPFNVLKATSGNYLAARSWAEAFEINLADYAIHSAEKPRR